MPTKTDVIFCLFLFATLNSVAAPSKVIVRSEESRWIAEVITQAGDGWPELAARKTFPTKAQADEQGRLFENQKALQMAPEVLFEPRMADGNLWPTQKSWSEDWEKRYADWIETEVDTEFFVRYQIATDCADVAYSLRWIFARIHGLPAAARIGGSKILLTNETVRTEWAKLPTSTEWHKDRRFLAALNYLLNMTYTHTLWEDSFPVALNRQAILSGSYHLNLHDNSGHTQLIHWLGQGSDVPFLTLNSTVPRKVRPLMDSLLFGTYPKDKTSAILRFRWAVKSSSGIILKKSSEMPGHSLEQYSFQSDKDFTLALFEKLGFMGGKEAIVNYIYKDIYEQFQARIAIVEQGFEKCQSIDCKPGSVGWEDWGTPSRDSRIRGKIFSLSSISMASSDPAKPNPNEAKEVIRLENTSWNVRSMIWNWEHSIFSSDPREAISWRWGAGKESWARQQRHFYTNQIQKRLEQLDKSQSICQKKDCSFGSPAWEDTSSNKIDLEMVARNKYILNGSSHLPAETLSILAAEGDAVLGIVRGVPISLNHILNHQINMNSSAMASFEEQWALGTRPLMQMKSPHMGPYFDHWLLDSQSLKLYDRETGALISFDGAQTLAAFKKAPVLILNQNENLELIDLSTGRRKQLPQASFDGNLRFATSTSGRLITQSIAQGTQIWDLDAQTLTLNPVHQLHGSQWMLVREDFLTEIGTEIGGRTLDVSNLTFLDATMSGAPFVFNERRIGFRDLRTGENVVWDRALKRKFTLPVGLSEAMNHMTEDGSFLITELLGQSHIYNFDSEFKIKSIEKILASCRHEIQDYYACYDAQGLTFYKNQNGQFLKVVSGTHLRWITDDYLGVRDGNGNIEVTDRKTMRILIKGPEIQPLTGSFVMMKMIHQGMAHLVDLNNPGQPLFTNLFQYIFNPKAVAKNGDLLLYEWGSSAFAEAILWKKGLD